MYNLIYKKDDSKITLDDFKNKINEVLKGVINTSVARDKRLSKLDKLVESVAVKPIILKGCVAKVQFPTIGDDKIENIGYVFMSFYPDKPYTIEKAYFEYMQDFKCKYVHELVDEMSYKYAWDERNILLEQIKKMQKTCKNMKEWVKEHEALIHNLLKDDKPNSFPDGLMQVLRRQRGLELDDTSQDAKINKYTPQEAFESWCLWEGLLGGYDTKIIKAIENCFDIELN